MDEEKTSGIDPVVSLVVITYTLFGAFILVVRLVF